MRQGRLWNSRGGLAALANDSYGELTLGSCPFPQPCSATLAVAELEISCFAFGRSPCQLSCGLLVSQCSSDCLGVCLGAALCTYVQGSPGTVFLRGLTPE